jgi:amidase
MVSRWRAAVYWAAAHREKETMSAPKICFLTATELVRLVRAKELSALEVMEAHLAQIERVNPEVNAIVTLTAEQAMDRARATSGSLPLSPMLSPLASTSAQGPSCLITEKPRVFW